MNETFIIERQSDTQNAFDILLLAATAFVVQLFVEIGKWYFSKINKNRNSFSSTAEKLRIRSSGQGADVIFTKRMRALDKF